MQCTHSSEHLSIHLAFRHLIPMIQGTEVRLKLTRNGEFVEVSVLRGGVYLQGQDDVSPRAYAGHLQASVS